mmetsp:Transcript_48131/g.114373  ORF Transcript_48131/g.114373 Transcript_48131/m.114373 type:complete len:245 (+) Transcript_48131:885-1619(+)
MSASKNFVRAIALQAATTSFGFMVPLRSHFCRDDDRSIILPKLCTLSRASRLAFSSSSSSSFSSLLVSSFVSLPSSAASSFSTSSSESIQANSFSFFRPGAGVVSDSACSPFAAPSSPSAPLVPAGCSLAPSFSLSSVDGGASAAGAASAAAGAAAAGVAPEPSPSLLLAATASAAGAAAVALAGAAAEVAVASGGAVTLELVASSKPSSSLAAAHLLEALRWDAGNCSFFLPRVAIFCFFSLA